MSSQAAIFAETIANLKRAVQRNAYDSDSDNSIEGTTNRGNKLKKRARFVHQGRLAPPTGPEAYRSRITHAGYERDIISRNPPRVDEDGDEIDSEDDDERTHAAIAAAAESNPYSAVKIEQILAPLTSASDLPTHPTLSKPFTSKILTDLTADAERMLQRENHSLWRIKHLLTRLSGDNTWIPCESVETENDMDFFQNPWQKVANNHLDIVMEDALSAAGVSTPENGAQRIITQGPQSTNSVTNGSDADAQADKDVTMNSVPNCMPSVNGSSGIDSAHAKVHINAEETLDGVLEAFIAKGKEPEAVTGMGPHVQEDTEMAGADDAEEPVIPPRMRTRAQANAASGTASRTRSATPASDYESQIDPFFLAPPKSHPDRDLGLPPNEAEETRKLLQLYIQKQEEVCRGAKRIHEGLLKADQNRRAVLEWAKSEGHLENEDGEDWYDKEYWGLKEDLKKGENEEDEDPVAQAKKTRTRRQ